MSMSDQNKRLTRGVLEKMFGKGNLDAADELVHPEFVNHEAPPPPAAPGDARASRRRWSGSAASGGR